MCFIFSGQVKANSANVATRNIPATNGVIHAIDGLLWRKNLVNTQIYAYFVINLKLMLRNA